MDMVCEKTPDCDKNMDEDGLDLEVMVISYLLREQRLVVMME